jgi:periplasmic protein TonB
MAESRTRADGNLLQKCGVYQGVFEQSILLNQGTDKKTGALAVSVTLQTLAVSALVLIPLAYNDRLPAVRVFGLLPMAPLSRAPEPAAAAKPTPAIHRSLSVSRVFRPLEKEPHPLHSTASTIITGFDLPAVGSTTAPVGLPPVVEPVPLARVADAPAPPVAKAGTSDKPVPIGGDVLAARIVRKVVPVYPPVARQARISGTVQLIGMIAKDGTIRNLQVVSGNPLLVKAALDAVRQWVYRPTLLNGEPVEVIAPIDVIFTLSR